jgi:hypothetical protein
MVAVEARGHLKHLFCGLDSGRRYGLAAATLYQLARTLSRHFQMGLHSQYPFLV